MIARAAHHPSLGEGRLQRDESTQREAALDPALSDRAFWEEFWRSKPDLAQEVPRDIVLHDLFEAVLRDGTHRDAIELGGFPGSYSVFLARYFGLDVTLLDFVVDRGIFASLLERNGLVPDAVQLIESDLFDFSTDRRWDLVFSLGLIEHFRDTEAVLRKHVALLSDNGTLLVTVPNLRGLNGLFQRVFDRECYDTHNLECMDPDYLAELLEGLGLRDVRAGYHLRFGLWLEESSGRGPLVRALEKAASLAGRAAFRLGPPTSRAGSPFIFATGRR